jgi:hypothetical protein
MHMATISPTNRSLPEARIGSVECLKPGSGGLDEIGLTPRRSFAVNTTSRN